MKRQETEAQRRARLLSLRDYRERHPEDPAAHTARAARWAADHPEARRAIRRRYRERHADRIRVENRAHVMVREAVKTGRLVREPCRVCGELSVQGHHPNGYGPGHELDVEWLCAADHRAAHRAA